MLRKNAEQHDYRFLKHPNVLLSRVSKGDDKCPNDAFGPLEWVLNCSRRNMSY